MVPSSILAIFMNCIWELGVGRVLIFMDLVLPSFLHAMSEEGLGTSKNGKEVVMETSFHSYSEWLIHSIPRIEVPFSSV